MRHLLCRNCHTLQKRQRTKPTFVALSESNNALLVFALMPRLSTHQDLFKAGQFADAAAKYTQALEAAPDSAVILTNRSAAYLKAEEAEKALEDAKKAAEVSPFLFPSLALSWLKPTLLSSCSWIPNGQKHGRGWQRLSRPLRRRRETPTP